MSKKRGFHHYLEILVIVLVAVVLSLFRGTPQGIDQTLTAGAAACPIIDGGVGDDDATANGTVTISSSKTFVAITGSYDCTATPFLITGSGTLILDGNPATGQIAVVNFGALTVDVGGVIHSNFEGCATGTGQGFGPTSLTNNICISNGLGFGGQGGGGVNTAGAGGGHGGFGGASSTGATAGDVFGSSVAPVLFGASGGGGNAAGADGGTGGGVVRIIVTGTFTHNGTISANAGAGGSTGTSGRAGGGGAGGSIFVTAGTLTGTGSFSATGGAGGDNTADGGGGAGGRIAILRGGGAYAVDAGDFTVTGGAVTGTAVAGQRGAVYTKNTSANTVAIFHGFIYDDTDHFVSSWTTDPSATSQYCDLALGASASPSVHTTGALTFGGTLNCSTSVASFTLDAGTALALSNAAALSTNGAVLLTAGSSFSVGTGAMVANTKTNTDIEFNIPAGNTQTWDGLTVTVAPEGEFITDDAFGLTLQNGTAINGSVRWTALTSLTQNSGTSINADARGCLGDTDQGNGPTSLTNNTCVNSGLGFGAQGGGGGNTAGTGAGHGGVGGASTTSGVIGDQFDSAIAVPLRRVGRRRQRRRR